MDSSKDTKDMTESEVNDILWRNLITEDFRRAYMLYISLVVI